MAGARHLTCPKRTRKELFEVLLLVLLERADQREVQPVLADHVLRDSLHVLGRHGVESREHLVRLGAPPSSTSRRSPNMISPCGLSSLEHEAALRDVPRLLELVGRHGLVGDLAQLARRSS